MAHTVKDNDCVACSVCEPTCPQGAIKPRDDQDGFWVDPTLCNDCEGEVVPLCINICDSEALVPLQPKKGRCKSTLLPAAIPDIFLNGKTNAFASSMVIWEGCNVLSQRLSLPWQPDSQGKLCYQRAVNRGRGMMQFRLARDPSANVLVPAETEEAIAALAGFDLRAACVHLIFAAYATTLDCPWEESFSLNDQHIEQYLGLHKRKDLTKLDKLTLIKQCVYQACQLMVSLNWPRQGRVQAFALDEHPIWELQQTEYFFETDNQGYRHLIGLSFTIQPGIWAKHFLNKREYRRQGGFYQYGTLPQSLLFEVMSHWQQHEGAVRLLLWLLFKLRLGGDHRMTVRTLLRIAYGEERLLEATTVRGAHKRLLRTFENDLEAIYYYGLKPVFDPETYPSEIQPLWVKVAQIPEGADDALEFWADDANLEQSLTDAAPRDKWQRLLNARLLGFELSEEWQQTIKRTTPKRRRSSKVIPHDPEQGLTSSAIKAARQRLNLSQRALADRLGKSQSWIRDIEKGRFAASAEDRELLKQTLEIS
jgi:DNA-binding transcriptional regulator YiaG/Pyruvate/2-oxoacid:ferredoxin oxidoreductase delta subunit